MPDITIAIIWEKWNLWSLNPMRARKGVSRPKSGSTSKRTSLSRGRKIRVGIEPLDRFFSACGPTLVSWTVPKGWRQA